MILASVWKTRNIFQVNFHSSGDRLLKESNSEPWKIEKMTTTIRHNRNNALSVLIIDVEGAEWYLIEDLMKLSWDELAIELHFPHGSIVFVATPLPVS